MPGQEYGSSQVAIVHLARCANGDAALQDFLKSYRELSPGIKHDLVVVLKGYEQDPRSREIALEALRPHRALTLAIPDDGLDLDVYRIAVNTFDYSYYCFLNSFSRPTCEAWLRHMMHWVQQPGVGIVGAFGSYQSFFSDHIDAFRRELMRYVRIGRAPASTGAPDLGPEGWSLHRGLRRPIRSYLLYPFRCIRTLWYFAAFPNTHIRTNGFILSRQVINRLHWPPTTTKLDAYIVESGRRGITSQVVRMGLEAVVVGRDGRGYSRPEWPGSGTFWQGNQDNLLIADNQTREYELGSPARQRRLCRLAWHDLVAPNF